MNRLGWLSVGASLPLAAPAAYTQGDGVEHVGHHYVTALRVARANGADAGLATRSVQDWQPAGSAVGAGAGAV